MNTRAPTLLSPGQARERLGAPSLGVIAARDFEPNVAGRRPVDGLARAVLRRLRDAEGAEGAAIGGCLFLASTAAAAPARRRLAERIATLGAGDGRQALLIDGDLAAGGEKPGLVELLRGDGSIADLAYREDEAPFQRLASGAGDPFDAPARHGGDAFRLRRLRRSYDLVALDGGLMSDNPRIAALAAEADVVLLVAALGEPQSALALEAESALASGARFDAVALIDLTAAERCGRRRLR